MKLVVSAFPAVGKSTIFKEAAERGLKPAHVHFNDFTKEYEITVPAGDGIPVFDSDSSKFDKEFFPTNYIQHIKATLEKLDDVIILVSSHKDVREMLRSQGIDYVLAYPQRELKEEYIRRYKARGNAEGFIGMMENSWNDFIDSCEEDPTEAKIVLGEDEFLGQDYLTGDLFDLAGMENMNDDPNWFNKSLKEGIKEWAKDLGSPDKFHDSLKQAIAESQGAETNPIDFEARLQRMKERRDPQGIEEEKVVMVDLPILHFPDGSTGNASDQVEIVRYNNEWQAYLAENPGADVSYMPIEIMGGESMGDILHAPNGVTIDMAQPGWHDQYKSACNVVLEEKPDTLITATIVDVNAGPEVTEQQTLPTDNPEPTILNTPESTEDATLTAEAPEGGIAAVDAATIAEPGPEVSTEAAERNPMVDPEFVEAIEPASPDRAELIEAKFEMQNDIETLETVVETYNSTEPDSSGMEQFADGSELLTTAAEDIKERYGVEVEPTIAGMEGFFSKLKEGLGKVADTLKGKPNKAGLAKIKKYFYESRKAVDEYSSPTWLNAQKFINVGNAKLQVPAVFKEVNTADGMRPIVEQFSKTVMKLNDEHLRNNKARLASGIKIFNALKNKPGSTKDAENDKLIANAGSVKPDALADVKLNDVKSLINVSLAPGELPVLKKDDIPGIIKILQDGLNVIDKLVNANEDYKMNLLTYDDIFDSDFWSDAKSPAAKKVIEAIEFEHNYHNLDMIEEGYVQQMLVIAKFVEMWILSSVK